MMHRKVFSWFTTMFLTVILFGSGCAAVGAMGSHIKGGYYLNEKDYRGGVRAFQEKLAKNPNDALANYYMGRYLLALDKNREALPHLKRATTLKPNDAELWFWLGVGYWSVQDFSNERKSYQKAIALNRLHVPAHVYLGHNYQDKRQYRPALNEYDTALKMDPYQPEALFNRGMVLGKMGKRSEEKKAWIEYLGSYPDGALARDAARNLNALGSFSYRNHLIGKRTMTLEWIKFKPGTSDLSADAMPSLRVVGSIMSVNKRFRLEIRSYYKGNQELARARGQAVKEFILKRNPEITPDRLTVVAYGRPEGINAGGKVYSLNASVVFWTR